MENARHTDFYEKRKHGKFRLVETPDVSFPVADTHCHLEMSEDPAWLFVRCAVHNVKFLACVVDSTDDGPEALQKVETAWAEGSEIFGTFLHQGDTVEGQHCPQGAKMTQKPPTPRRKNDPKTSVPKLRYIVGTHPHHAKRWNANEEKKLREMLQNPKVTCVGEIGLDYHYDLSPKEDQLKVFEAQLKIAEEMGLPVALHIREAHEDALKIINKVGWNSHGTLLHCFTLGPEDVKPWVEAGCYVAFGGAMTFKKLEEVREATKLVPPDKLLTETDSPFMTPEPMRGMECYPDHVIFVAKKLYEILGEGQDKEKFYSQIYQNALDLLDK